MIHFGEERDEDKISPKHFNIMCSSQCPNLEIESWEKACPPPPTKHVGYLEGLRHSNITVVLDLLLQFIVFFLLGRYKFGMFPCHITTAPGFREQFICHANLFSTVTRSGRCKPSRQDLHPMIGKSEHI